MEFTTAQRGARLLIYECYKYVINARAKAEQQPIMSTYVERAGSATNSLNHVARPNGRFHCEVQTRPGNQVLQSDQ